MNMENNNCCAPSVTSNNGNAANVSNDGSGSEEIGDSQDEEPSSNQHHHVQAELENFRLQWKKEIELLPEKEQSPGLQHEKLKNESDEDSTEEKARNLFMHGMQAEKAGKLQDAISYYRRAIQLVPDIEFRVADFMNDYADDLFSEDSEQESTYENSEESEGEVEDNLVIKFQKLSLKTGATRICQQKHAQQASHISALPPEIFIYILKWVVSQELDTFSLEQLSRVCRGFYLCARDPEIWRLVCLRIWEASIDSPNKYGSWRNMFIQRPHLSYCGAYISKTSYIRYGESSFQDTHYRPCYLVEYYRYLRFFPEGLVLMLTTPDDPYQSLSKLHRNMRHQNVMHGRYKLVGNTVVAIIKKSKSETSGVNYNRYRKQKQANLHEVCDHTFHLELEMNNTKKRYNCQLTWNRYSIHMVHRNGQETVSDLDLTPSKFPCFWFSRVKSYAAESESPLK